MGSIQSCKLAIGYRSPLERDGCHNCANVRKVGAGLRDIAFRECGLHGFMVAATAICNKHVAAAQKGGAA
jgi:hypothetical protein